MDILTYGLLNKKIEEVKNVSGEKITEAVNGYLNENPPTTGATAEQVAQINKNESDIGELKSDLDNTKLIAENNESVFNDALLCYTNLVANADYTEDYCYYTGTKNPRNLPTANVGMLSPIRIRKGVTYYYRALYGYFCWIVYDSDLDTEIRLTDSTSTVANGEITPTDDGFIYISVSKTSYNTKTDCFFTEHSLVINRRLYDGFYVGNKFSESKTFVLDVGESGHSFTSLRQALEYAEANYDEHIIYEIAMYYDDYDVSVDLTSEELSTSSSYIGLEVTKNVRIVGMNNYRKCLIHLELADNLDDSVKKRISTLNLKDNGELHNVTVSAKNCRYAVHDDYSTMTDIEKTISDCKFISDNTFYHRAYGAGYRSGYKWTFKNCIFENKEITPYSPFSAHNNLGFEKPAYIEFENCKFIATNESSDGYGVMFGSLNTDTDIVNTVMFKGCSIIGAKRPVWLYEENASAFGKGCKVAVTGYGNNFTNLNVTIYTTDGVDYSDYKQLH